MIDGMTKTRQMAIAAMCAGIFASSGCGGGGTDQTTTKPADKPTTTPPAALTARVSGKINFTGVAPKAVKIQMDADPICKKQHTMEMYTQEYIVDGNGMLANVFVYVKNYAGPKPAAAKDTVIFDQKGCQYFPHVFGMRSGQPMVILNSDPTLHNVHALPTQSGQFNLAMPKEGMRVTKTFDKPEVMVKIKCDVHSWMNAYVGVLDHPYFAVTDASGSFNIGPLPPGTYEIEAWHEKLGTMTQSVTVGDNQTGAANFSFAPKAGA